MVLASSSWLCVSLVVNPCFGIPLVSPLLPPPFVTIAAFGYLSEQEWELIVRRRHERTAPGARKRMLPGQASMPAPARPVTFSCAPPTTGGLDGKGRTVPAISASILMEIEDGNEHLSRSAVVDELVWKDCVEYRFKTGGGSRPLWYRYPWPVLIARLKKIAEELHSVLEPPSDGEKIWFDKLLSHGMSLPVAPTEDNFEQHIQWRREDRLARHVLQELELTPMSVPLLSASGIGRSLKKFLKEYRKICPPEAGGDQSDKSPVYVPRIYSPFPTTESPSIIDSLEKILCGWKAVASSSGVTITKVENVAGAHNATAEQTFSGRSKRISEEEHAEDMAVVQSCSQWRDVFKALTRRESAKIARQGEKMRKLRQNIESDRPKIGKVTGKLSTKVTRKLERHDAILSGSRGARQIAATRASASYASRGTSKMKALRKEVAYKMSCQGTVGSGATRSPSAPPLRKTAAHITRKQPSFGAAIARSKRATAIAPARRGIVGTSISSKGGVDLGGGKKMTLPKALPGKRGNLGVFSSIAEKKRKANAMHGYAKKQRQGDGR